MPRKKFKCSKCDRTFKMAAHLARHKSSAHGSKKKRTTIKRAKKRISKRKGRPRGVAVRLGLKDMSLEQLIDVINAARREAQHRIADLEASIG